MKHFFYALLWIPLLFFSSCRDWETRDLCLNGEKRDVIFKFELDSIFSDYKDIFYESPDSLLTRADNNDLHLRYFLSIYKYNNKKSPVATTVVDKTTTSFLLPYGKYDVVVWADFVGKDIYKDNYFFTDDLFEMLLKSKISYQGNDPFKMAFRSVSEMTVTANVDALEHRVTLSPAMGRMVLKATKPAEGYTVSKVKVIYNKTVPSAINAWTGKISYAWADVDYSTLPMNDFIGFDNIYAVDSETIVPITVISYDQDGNIRGRINNIDVPIVRKGITTVSADFFNAYELNPNDHSSGGISIKTEFDEIIHIEI